MNRIGNRYGMSALFAIAAFALAPFACDAAPNGRLIAKPKVPPEPPPNVRLYSPTTDKGYCSGVPYEDGVLTVAHSNARAGMKLSTSVGGIYYERRISGVQRVTLPGITPGGGKENLAGDVLYLALDRPFPKEVPRAIVDTKAPDLAQVAVTHQDGVRSPRIVVRFAYRVQMQFNRVPDGANPRWLYLGTAGPKTRLSVPGDSGGGIYRGAKLVSLVSRGDLPPYGYMQGPNLARKDARALLP